MRLLNYQNIEAIDELSEFISLAYLGMFRKFYRNSGSERTEAEDVQKIGL